MKNNNWEKISASFEQALALPDSERNQYLLLLARNQGENFASEVKALLQADQDSSEFLGTNAMQLTAKLVAENTAEILANEKFGNYRILEKLGAGGMGEVFLAQDEILGRRVALKFLPQIFMQDDNQRTRFEQEARAASALNHPNILTVYEIGTANGRAFIATEFVEGQTLREKIQTQKFSLSDVLQIAEQVGEALNAAHSAGLIHRDIKPENLMVRPDGYVKVLDFGLAKLVGLQIADLGLPQENLSQPSLHLSLNSLQPTIRNPQSTRLRGTPKYMSPEQVRGEALDGRSDLWSLGVTLYELLTGTALWAGTSAEQVLQAICEQKVINWDLPEEQNFLLPILQKLVAYNLADRYSNAQEFLAAIKQVRRPSEKQTGRTTRKYFVAGLLLVICALIFFGWRKMQNHVAQTQKLYWELSAVEQTQFLQSAAPIIATQLGADSAPLQPAQIVLIKKYVDNYVSKRDSLATTPGKESIKAVYARASVYAPFIIDEFRARDLPPILGLYVAMNETEFHPCTASLVGAKGLFSFMPQTAERYGLQLKPQDERCNPRKIANAAAQYLEDLTKQFGRDADAMTLALMAYNCGEGCVAQKIAELKKLKVEKFNSWILLENNARLSAPIGEESRTYVPKFFAAAIIGENPARFGLEIQRLTAYMRH